MRKQRDDLKTARDEIDQVNSRLRVRNREVAALLEDAQGIICDLSVLLPPGAHHRAIEYRKAKERSGHRDNHFAIAGRIETDKPLDRHLEQSDDLGADALDAARLWRNRMARLASTNVLDDSPIPF
jgi:hypothetical protein